MSLVLSRRAVLAAETAVAGTGLRLHGLSQFVRPERS